MCQIVFGVKDTYLKMKTFSTDILVSGRCGTLSDCVTAFLSVQHEMLLGRMWFPTAQSPGGLAMQNDFLFGWK